MKTEEFIEARSLIRDKDLVEKAQMILSDLCRSNGTGFRMTIPPSLDDYDIILQELINRFRGAIQPEVQKGEIVYRIPKSIIDVISQKLTDLDELKVYFDSDYKIMMKNALNELTKGIKELRKIFSDYEKLLE